MQDELQSWFINNTYQVEQEKPAKLQGAICPENEGGGEQYQYERQSAVTLATSYIFQYETTIK